MELNAEINKIFGQEMAKLFALQISEEELGVTAKKAWNKLNTEGRSYWNNESDMDRMVKAAIAERLKEEVTKIIETDEFKKDVEAKARQIVDEIKEETHKKLVDEVSTRLATLSTGYGGYGLRSYIEDIIRENMQR